MFPGTKATPHLGVTAQPLSETQRVRRYGHRCMRIYHVTGTDRKSHAQGLQPCCQILFMYLFIKIGWEIRLVFEMFASLIIGIDIGACHYYYIIIVLL